MRVRGVCRGLTVSGPLLAWEPLTGALLEGTVAGDCY